MNESRPGTSAGWRLTVLLILAIAAQTALPAAVAAQDEAPSVEVEDAEKILFYGDLVGALNPSALSGFFGLRWRDVYQRDSEDPLWDELYYEFGFNVDPNPAYIQVGPHVEWSPIAVLKLRLQYSLQGYFGEQSGLYSFPSKHAKFGDRERDDRDGKEESGFVQRFLFQMTLQARWDSLIVRNQSDFAAFFIPGKGPYLLDLEWDTLLKEDRDLLVANRSQVLVEAWKNGPEEKILAGLQYELVHAHAAKLNRQRLGVLFYMVPVERLDFAVRPRFYIWTGINLQDRNRNREAFLAGGLGFDM